MTRLIFLHLLPVFLLRCTGNPDEKPNVILFVVDDLGWTDLGCYDSDLYQTLAVDRLAREGMQFTDAYTACTVWSPTRASLMTGKYPARLHCTDWITGHKRPYARMTVPDWTMYVDTSEYTLAEALRDEGYHTIHLGKWHLGEAEIYWPEFQGFDINVGGWKVGSPRGEKGRRYFSPYNNPRLPDGPRDEYLTERLAEEAVGFIRDHSASSQPFFMNFWFYNVHLPLNAREEKVYKYREQVAESANHFNPVYAAMVEHMDDAVGAVIQTLEETGQDQNTLIIFTSDNGGIVGNSGSGNRRSTSNAPLRSGKGDMYEGGVRVPFIAWWSGKIPAGTTCSEPLISPDVYPTILGFLGIQNEKARRQIADGVDFSQTILYDEPPEREAIFWHYPHYHAEGARPYSAIRKDEWKLLKVFDEEGLQLFNLAEDLSESTDLWGEYPEKAAELLGDLEQWWKEVDAQFATENPAYDPARDLQ